MNNVNGGVIFSDNVKIEYGYIYVCTTFEYMKKNQFKIGKSKSPFVRVDDYIDGRTIDDRVFLVTVIKCDFMDYNIFEKYCHDKLMFKKMEGCEYFVIQYPVLKVLLEMFIITNIILNKEVNNLVNEIINICTASNFILYDKNTQMEIYEDIKRNNTLQYVFNDKIMEIFGYLINENWKISDITEDVVQYVNLVIFGYKNVFTVEQVCKLISKEVFDIKEGSVKEITEYTKKIIEDDKQKNKQKITKKNTKKNTDKDNTKKNTNKDNSTNNDITITGGGLLNIKENNELFYIKEYNIYICDKHLCQYKHVFQKY